MSIFKPNGTDEIVVTALITNCPDPTPDEEHQAEAAAAHMAHHLVPGYAGKVSTSATIRETIDSSKHHGCLVSKVADDGMWHLFAFVNEAGDPYRFARGFSFEHGDKLVIFVTEPNVVYDAVVIVE